MRPSQPPPDAFGPDSIQPLLWPIHPHIINATHVRCRRKGLDLVRVDREDACCGRPVQFSTANPPHFIEYMPWGGSCHANFNVPGCSGFVGVWRHECFWAFRRAGGRAGGRMTRAGLRYRAQRKNPEQMQIADRLFACFSWLVVFLPWLVIHVLKTEALARLSCVYVPRSFWTNARVLALRYKQTGVWMRMTCAC